MAKLIEFKKTESELFEALSVIFFTVDQPSPAENKSSIKAEDLFQKYGKETKESQFKNTNCGFCGNRIGHNPRIFTLPEGSGADLVLDDKVFEYMESRFDKWQSIIDSKLKRPFEELKDRFAAAKTAKNLQDFDGIMSHLKTRDVLSPGAVLSPSADALSSKAVTAE